MKFASIKLYIISSLFFSVIAVPLNSLSQENITDRKISDIGFERISAYGKLWGIINYFHPAMGKGHLDGDSLFLSNISRIILNPSADNFNESVTKMLSGLNDPRSNIVVAENLQNIKNPVARKSFATSVISSNQFYISLPQTAFRNRIEPDSILSNIKARKIILDLRCNELNNDLGLKQYKSFVQPLISSLIESNMLLATERSFFYKGLMRQDFPQDINLFNPDNDGNLEHLQIHNGLKNISEGAYLLASAKKNYSSYQYCFVINRFTNVNTVKAIMALRNRGGCLVIFDGSVPDYMFGTFYYQNLPDGLRAKVRISEVIYEDGTLGCKPDIIFEQQSDTSLASNVIQKASTLLKSKIYTPILASENTVFIRKPVIRTDTSSIPKAEQRLLGLFNFWNAIHFFSPNKNLISVNWDTSLPRFVGKFLTASTKDKYFLSLMELTASIKDGHGILINTKTGRSPIGFMDGNLPFACEQIDGKVYITSIMPDSLQKQSLSRLHYGDEVIAIAGQPVDSIIKRWEPLLVASNQSGFKRELFATWFTAGTIGKAAIITVLRAGIEHTVSLNRIDRNQYYNLWGKVIRPEATPSIFPPNWKILEGNIGYIRMNKVFSKELDTIAHSLKNCKNIIIDARGYPRDGTIGTNLAAYISAKTDTVSYDIFPFVTSPDLNKRQMLIDYSVIEPKTNTGLKRKNYYILVDEGIQSQGEWNVIAVQGVTKATTIGRKSAGANGMAVTVTLPGNYITFFSGFGEYYMDHTPNQKNGVKVDIEVNKTLKAAISGTDDILQKALEVILKRQ